MNWSRLMPWKREGDQEGEGREDVRNHNQSNWCLYAAEVKPKARNQASRSTRPSSTPKNEEKKNDPPAARFATPGSQERAKVRTEQIELTSFFRFFLYFLLRLL